LIINKRGFELLKYLEGLVLTAYKCEAGHWTIGYGDTRNVKPGDVITAEEAEARLIKRIEEFENELKYLMVGAMVNSNQWSAIVCFVYNIGITEFRTSTFRKLLPYSKTLAAEEFDKWNKITDKKTGKKVVSKVLTRRRKLEKELFLDPNCEDSNE
jgi:lysozyme